MKRGERELLSPTPTCENDAPQTQIEFNAYGQSGNKLTRIITTHSEAVATGKRYMGIAFAC